MSANHSNINKNVLFHNPSIAIFMYIHWKNLLGPRINNIVRLYFQNDQLVLNA